MKNIFTALVICLVASISLSSCKKEGCTDSKATNYDSKAKDDDGTCQYPPYYQFIGSYTMNDTFDIGNKTYTIIIQETGFDDKIKIVNLFDSGNTYEATVSGNDFVIPSQYYVAGSGAISNGVITMDFSYKGTPHRGTATPK